MAVQRHFDAVVEVGKSFGLELNLGKTVVLRIRGNTEINGPHGTPLKVRSSCVYVGGMLCDDGRPVSEVTRRLGEARRGFQNLASVWRHANISKKRKKLIQEACIISKLLYGLESLWLLKCDRDKMDGFYANLSKAHPEDPISFLFQSLKCNCTSQSGRDASFKPTPGPAVEIVWQTCLGQ